MERVPRKINFNAGPAALPDSVLQQAARATLEYENTGMSILELPHRGKEFVNIIAESKTLVRELAGVNEDYEILWLQGGGRMQFCMIPMNFLPADGSGGYIDSGHWSGEALEYAMHYGDVQILCSSRTANYNHLPDWPRKVSPQLSYLHFTTNNTIYGTQWHHIPKTDVPLIADMSSDIFWSRHDHSRYGMFYAAVQKNLGTPGVALVGVRKDMLDRIVRTLPPMLSYKAQADENSILNTANVSGVYTSLLMLRWIKEQGIDNIEAANRRKAKKVYDAIDGSSIFSPHVAVEEHRSMMNVCFTAKTPEIEKAFLSYCDKQDIVGIKGHRSVGGFRISLYNAVPVTWAETITQVMKEFENKY